MIIYGTNATRLKSEQAKNIKCPNCDTENSVNLGVFGKYAHVFWIPFFTLGRRGYSKCGNCQQELTVKKMPESLKLAYDTLKLETKIPFWHFSGVILLSLLIGWTAYESELDDEANLQYINDPKSGDVYEIKTNTNNYTLIKVREVTGDSLFVSYNEYEVTKASGLYKLEGEENFSRELYSIARTTIKEMFESGEIRDVDRQE